MWTRPVRLGGRAQLDMHVVFPVQPSAPRAVVLRERARRAKLKALKVGTPREPTALNRLKYIGVCAWWC